MDLVPFLMRASICWHRNCSMLSGCLYAKSVVKSYDKKKFQIVNRSIKNSSWLSLAFRCSCWNVNCCPSVHFITTETRRQYWVQDRERSQAISNLGELGAQISSQYWGCKWRNCQKWSPKAQGWVKMDLLPHYGQSQKKARPRILV